MKYYMLVLIGNSDTAIKFVNKETWDWITDTTGEVKLPQSQSDAPITYPDIKAWSIDKALSAQPDIGETFCTLKEAIGFIKENNLEIVDEYVGSFY